VPVLNSSDV